MPHDHAADVAKVKDALKSHKGKGVPQIEARLRAFLATSAANYHAAPEADRPSQIEYLLAHGDDAIKLVMTGE